MSKRLVHLLLALGLVASALAAAVPAAAQDLPGPENPGQSAIFYPYVPNGVDIEEDNGPWFGVITVQNIEEFPVVIDIRKPGSGSVITSAVLNARASKTFSADALDIADGSGGGVYVTARFQSLGAVIDAGLCQQSTFTVIRGSDPDGVDTLDTGLPSVDRARVPGYTLGTDYNVTIDNGTVDIDWGPAGDEPDEGESYTVRVWDCVAPRISGTEKHASVNLSAAGRTSATTVAVTGYTAIPLWDLALSRGLAADSLLGDVLGETGQWNWAFPIVQTNNGWNSVIHVTNFSRFNNCGVTVIFYESPSGYSDPSFGNFTTLLNAGQTANVDLLALGFPTGMNNWVGQAWVSADCAIAATVDRLKDETDMALTLIAQPRVDDGQYTKYGPLVFENFNGWNTGITLANLSDTDANTVTVSFYNQAGQLVSSDQRVLQPRAVEYVYRPSTADVGTGGVVGDLQQVVVSGTAPVAAAADSVKYRGQRLQGQGQALSYLLQGGATNGQLLSVPLIQKGTSLAPSGQFSGDTSGVQLFNANASGPATVAYAFYDQTGALVAPTLTGPVVTTIGALSAATLYTPFFAEMPAGFQGAFQAKVRSGIGPVAAVSNNVNYDVVGDGTAAYNAAIHWGRVLLELDPASALNVLPDDTEHTVTATLLDADTDLPLAGVTIYFTVEDAEDDAIAEGVGVTDADGEVSFSYTFTTDFTEALIFHSISAWADLDGDGTLDPGEPVTRVTKTWAFEEPVPSGFEAEPQYAENPVEIDEELISHTVTVTVFDQYDNPIEDVLVCVDVTSGPNEGAANEEEYEDPNCGLSNEDGEFVFTYTSNGTLGRDTIRVWVDLDDDGVVDDGETDVLIKDWVLGLSRILACDPEDATNDVGEEHTVTCTLTDGVGNPVEGVQVWAHVDGANSVVPPDAIDCGVTDEDGIAECTYTGENPGDDAITIWADLDEDGLPDEWEPFDIVAKTWVED